MTDPTARLEAQARLQRIVSAIVFGAGLLLGQFVPERVMWSAPAGILVGLGIPGLVRWLWGERTRPKADGFWLLAGPLLLIGAFFTGGFLLGGGQPNLVFPFCLLVGIYLVHDMSITPTLMITAGAMATVIRLEPGFEWTEVEEGKVWWVALGMLVVLTAALIERDRLSRRQGMIIPAQWLLIRVGIVSLWTILAIVFRKQLQVGVLFEALGIAVATQGGRWALMAIIVSCLLVIAFVLRAKKPKPAAPGTPG